jgi:hypothetical protein
MPANISAYEWPLNGTAHIAYQTNDNHIREVVGEPGGRWRDIDVTRGAGGPALESAIMSGYAWTAGRTRQIAYVSPMDTNGHVHELVQLQDRPWSYEDLMRQPTGAPASDGLTLIGYDWKTGETKQVVYTALDGHIHELSAGRVGMWQHTNLTQVTASPPAEGSLLSAFGWEAGRSKHVIYMSGDGHIHELMLVAGGSWSHTDLTEQGGAPLANGAALVGYGWERGGTRQVAYTGDDGDLYELVADVDNVWSFVDLMSLTSAPLPYGTALAGFGWETGGTKQVVYVAENNHVQQLETDGSGAWTHSDMMQLLHAPEASSSIILGYEWSTQFAKNIVYLDTRENPHLHSLLLKHGGRWEYDDLTDLTGAQTLV